ASTSKSLGELMAAGDIRPDFAALISPLVIELPPLRDRPEDLPLLSQHFLEELNRQGDRQIAGLDDEVAKLLTEHDWPRNLDELWEVIRDAHAVATGQVIVSTDLSARFRSEVAAAMPAPAQVPALNLDAILTEAETRVIRLALDRCRNNRTQAAALLGIHRTRLIRRIEQLGLGKDVAASTADATPSDTIVDGEQAGEGDELQEKTERGTS
ncbi:MAG: hypothetical protein NT069_04820, partial [Planctomycetota bacterium]|nr:hypothetical protein [Planctomycetota bacterium]